MTNYSRTKTAFALRQHLDVSAAAVNRLSTSSDMVADLEDIAEHVNDCFARGGKLLIVGNGGSAGDAQHIAAEFVGRFKLDRVPLPAIALTTDSSALTAIGNDYGFAHIFTRQVQAIGHPGDLLWAISTSGRSENVLNAMQAACETGMSVVGFTSFQQREKFAALCNASFVAQSGDTAVIQQLHMIAAHAIVDAVERTASGLS